MFFKKVVIVTRCEKIRIYLSYVQFYDRHSKNEINSQQ